MEVIRLECGGPYWAETHDFAQHCSWIAGKHLARLMREYRLTGWESVFAAIENGRVVGFCTLQREDYYPENRYSPWVSCIFVDERSRGKRISHRLIEAAILRAREIGFARVYIPSNLTGFYEKCGFSAIDALQNYAGDMDTIYARDIRDI